MPARPDPAPTRRQTSRQFHSWFKTGAAVALMRRLVCSPMPPADIVKLLTRAKGRDNAPATELKRFERDYQELKQEFGLAHYEWRGWRGFHHHATLCIAAYGFLVAQRLQTECSKKNLSFARCLPYPKLTFHGAPGRAQRHVPNSIKTL